MDQNKLNCFGFAKNFRRLRGNQTQTTLANQLGVSVQTISNWENLRQQPTMRMIARITEHFSLTIAELFEQN